MFPGWNDPSNLEFGIVKPRHLSAGTATSSTVGAWQIVIVDSGTRVDIARVR